VVNGVKGAITQISKIKLQKSETSGYRGTVVATTPANIDVPSPVVGDVVLMDNTSDGTATVYGEAHVYDGEKWVSTEESDALAMTYKDALALAELSKKTIHASEIYADLIVTKRLRVIDGVSRSISIGSDGILAKDGNGVVIHDLPDEPILTNNAYLGHMLWFQDSSTYKIYDVTNFPINTWTDVTCLTAGSTNVKAGVFKIYLNSDNNNVGVVEPFNFVWLRPKGSAWGASSDANTPEGRLYLEDRTGGIDSTASVYFLICPIGTDNKIQFRANAQPSGNYKRIVINQLGVLI
jgi:hypothetical protein